MKKAKRDLELEEVKQQVQIDPMTGVMNKRAYIEREIAIDERISKGEMEPFALILFDLNDLKFINDSLGHEEGDKYIIESTQFIAKYFEDIPIYRVGGDEFTVILLEKNYENKEKLLREFNHAVDENIKKGNRILISAGLSSYIPDKDGTMLQTFTRADREMYSRKYYLKSLRK